VVVHVRVIAGLGNPGTRYLTTRHNAGYQVADRVLAALGAQPLAAPGPDLLLWRAVTDRAVLYVVKPVTFMNLSGVAVRQVTERLGLAPDQLLVIYDCLDLALGRIRLRQGGSSGGHRGVDSVIRELGTDQFPRLRVGIGRPESGATIDYVLAPWTAAELPVIGQSLTAALAAVESLLAEGLPTAMNRFNGWAAAAVSAAETQGVDGIENLRIDLQSRPEEA